ncbi:hypothetical protein [Nocardia terpenica]|uniref:hypothetical protein n=1 Tax=Nocardia terpenica TaxID=455432 RepID=UPI000B081FC6|nr:hypothetical protein [Nocardia terpenica]NQE88993.1 hypothetical protein [Nocardia terpenica]
MPSTQPIEFSDNEDSRLTIVELDECLYLRIRPPDDADSAGFGYDLDEDQAETVMAAIAAWLKQRRG